MAFDIAADMPIEMNLYVCATIDVLTKHTITQYASAIKFNE